VKDFCLYHIFEAIFY